MAPFAEAFVIFNKLSGRNLLVALTGKLVELRLRPLPRDNALVIPSERLLKLISCQMQRLIHADMSELRPSVRRFAITGSMLKMSG